MNNRLMPRKAVPALSVRTLSGAIWTLSERRPERFSLIVFYRGYHCPICRTYVGELDRLLPELHARGVDVLAVSSDGRERAELARKEWGLKNLDLGYGLDLAAAREWGLYVSTARGKTSAGIEEPERFSEPGLFLVRPDGTLYWAAVQTMPFARPHFRDVLAGLDFVIKVDYPARGELE